MQWCSSPFTGLNPSMALLGAGIGTILFQIVTGWKVPIFLGSSFAFIAPIIFSMTTWGPEQPSLPLRRRLLCILSSLLPFA
ncbi:solute carrier family 23 protein [Ignatzschineria indica]|uniref:solute carrier family 23 protein n=1 Tax=Ignatzschineria indica TaxID=472583 RepID=UPI0036427ED6